MDIVDEQYGRGGCESDTGWQKQLALCFQSDKEHGNLSIKGPTLFPPLSRCCQPTRAGYVRVRCLSRTMYL